MANLPKGFGYLDVYAGTWGRLADQEQRYLHRQRSSLSDLRAFYDATAPHLDEIFGHLDRFPVDAPLPEPEAMLFSVSLGLLEAAQAVECYNQACVPYAPIDQRVSIEATQF